MKLMAVVFCTGGGGTICSVQVKALVSLGANAVICGRRQPTVPSPGPSELLFSPLAIGILFVMVGQD
jgi:hypothetical protein